ncbi:MAG TPA: O-antigen ligase family protein [Pyrinomonadaceae bacterium]|nr:O-antigen ligase family protein [Pyrinomonadaceae bacterium]
MTISTSNGPAAAPPSPRADAGPVAGTTPAGPAPAPAVAFPAEPPRTLWSRFIILVLCLAVVLSTLAFGTVHSWSLAVFQAGACVVVLLWMMDAWRTGTLRLSRNVLQWPLLGLFALGLAQLLPLGGGDAAGATGAPVSEAARSLSFHPYATRLVLVQILSLFVYFAAALAFIDTPRRLRLVVRAVVVFGFVLALFGLMQHFISPGLIYWVREPKQATPFGPYINRHHFAGYMELTLAVPLGLIFSGGVARERIPLYAFAVAIMCIALVMTNSRGGMLSMAAEMVFLVLAASAAGRGASEREGRGGEGRGRRVRAVAARAAVGLSMVAVVLVGVLYFGGEESLSRLVGTVNAQDPTTGRAHFWKGTIELIKDHPVAGVGLGAFSAAYPLYDTANGNFRLEQAHNDYLQILSDGGLIGGALGLAFVVALFWMAFKRIRSPDKFRRGVALGALAGCFGVLVHSFFDFTLHTTANALLFLVLAALATMNGRVEEAESGQRRQRRRRRRRSTIAEPNESAMPGTGRRPENKGAAAGAAGAVAPAHAD